MRRVDEQLGGRRRVLLLPECLGVGLLESSLGANEDDVSSDSCLDWWAGPSRHACSTHLSGL